MRIHTQLLPDDIYVMVRSIPGVSVRSMSEHGSRIRTRALDIRLEGTGGRSNTGLYGAGDYSGCTWDEWGAVFGRIYLADPEAVCGGSAKRPVYANADHYNWATGGRFATGEIPADTHPRHRWEHSGDSVTGSYSVRECKKCSAVSRYLAYGASWAESQVSA